MAGPFRLQPGPAGDLWVYATSSAGSGAPAPGHVIICHDLPRSKGSAHDVALTYPALADRLARETGFRVITATLRGAGDSGGDFSVQGWLDDLELVLDAEVPAGAPCWLIGFDFGGVLALRLASQREQVRGVACLGTAASLDAMAADADALLDRCRRAGVISTAGYPSSLETWVKELSILHPAEDAALLMGRPFLVVHGSADPYVSVSDASVLAGAATGPTELRVVHGAGHWLRADPRVIAILVGWLERRR